MHHRAGGFCAAVAGLLAVTASLVFAGAARPLPSCNLGQITKFGDPSLSAPSPVYPGSTITSTGGSWASCNESFTGFRHPTALHRRHNGFPLLYALVASQQKGLGLGISL